MAKKKKEEVVEEPQVQETVVVEAPMPQPTPVVKPKNTWEVKDRVYYLKGIKKPLSKSIRATNVYWFDEHLDFYVNGNLPYFTLLHLFRKHNRHFHFICRKSLLNI